MLTDVLWREEAQFITMHHRTCQEREVELRWLGRCHGVGIGDSNAVCGFVCGAQERRGDIEPVELISLLPQSEFT